MASESSNTDFDARTFKIWANTRQRSGWATMLQLGKVAGSRPDVVNESFQFT
jgi:hypothetical protein